MMGGTTLAYAILLYALGVAVVVTGVLLVVPRMSRKMRWLALLMEGFGVAMVLVSAYIPGMDLALSDGMLIVGALMILNGAVMQRRKGAMAPS